jgi:hypothetical protein
MRILYRQSSKLVSRSLIPRSPDLQTVLRIVLYILAVSVAADSAADEYRYTGIERVVAMSDPHGDHGAMLRTLGNAGIVDADGNWAGGETYLVITGDLLDRGPESRAIMDLVMRLEAQAPDSGGKVLLTLGNHEVMNLVGDLRYVSEGEYAAFADEETAAERDRWFRTLLSKRRVQTLGMIDEEQLRAEFDRDRPPGFYAHRRAFSSEGKYGRWLMQKPLMVVVNDTAYVHGGLPPMVADYSLEQLNERLRADINQYVLAMETLVDAGLIDPAVNFYEQAGIAEGLAAGAASQPSTAPAVLAAIDTVMALNESPVHGPESPLWYRGTVGCSVLAEGDVLAASLAAVGASRVVIGHTPTVTRRVLERFDGRVIEIDTGMFNAAYRGSGFAVILEDGAIAVAQEHTPELAAPVRHPRRVGDREAGLSAEALAELLASGNIAAVTEDSAGRTLVEIEHDGSTVTALFAESPGRKGRNPEIAAYRLDLMLGLELVPVTVEREVDGKRGTLQFMPDNARDEAYRSRSGQGGSAWCPLPRQWNSLYVFDALIRNESRLPTSMVYSTGNWQIMSMGHADAFGTGGDRPAYLKKQVLELTSTWLEALGSLTEEALSEQLGDVLSGRQISAIERRAGSLLKEAGASP